MDTGFRAWAKAVRLKDCLVVSEVFWICSCSGVEHLSGGVACSGVSWSHGSYHVVRRHVICHCHKYRDVHTLCSLGSFYSRSLHSRQFTLQFSCYLHSQSSCAILSTIYV